MHLAELLQTWRNKIYSPLYLSILIALLVISALFLNILFDVQSIQPSNSKLAATIYPPALETAWQQRDWDTTIKLLREMRTEQPDSQIIRNWLAHAFIQKGSMLRHRGFIEDAAHYFERALALTPHQSEAQREQQLAEQYLSGAEAYQAGDWAAAIEAFEAVWQREQQYVNIKDLLYSSYFNQGLAERAAEQYAAARPLFTAAQALRPDLPETRRQLAALDFAMAPSDKRRLAGFHTIPLENRLIIVGITEQEMWVYEDNELIFEFVISTGETGRETAIGEFEILNKIDMAYASTWNLDMPYWMGIYWAGPLQNGIHALPIVKHTGYKLWDGFLGQRVSYGCIILGDEDARTLYEWAEVGVTVKIVPSLQTWAAERQQQAAATTE